MLRFKSLAIAALVLSGGCYNVRPISTSTPAPGMRVSLAINDAGRVALGGAMGPEIKQVEGSLIRQQDSAYLMSVSGVNLINGGFQAWKGENVAIKREMVAGLYEKKFSKTRTIAFFAATAVAGAVLAPRAIKSFTEPEPIDTNVIATSKRPRGPAVSFGLTLRPRR